MFWLAHKRRFDTITGSSPALLWLNLLFLMALGLMPFVTDLIAENSGTAATVIYAGSAMVSLLLALLGIMSDGPD